MPFAEFIWSKILTVTVLVQCRYNGLVRQVFAIDINYCDWFSTATT